MIVYGEFECFVMQMLYVCVLCASYGSSQCFVLHDFQFVNAGRGCNCDDVCMCVVNKQFELLEFVSESVYVDLQYDEIYLPTTTHSQQNSTQKLDQQKHATRSQYTGAKQRDLHPHKHKQDRNLEGTHKKNMGSQKKHKHLLVHYTRTSQQTTTTAGQQLHNLQGKHTY